MNDQEIDRTTTASAGPADASAATAAECLKNRPTPPAPPRPLISDEEEYMVESFVTGLLTCPEKYHDCFIDSWMDSHPAGRGLLLAAYMIVDMVEKFHKVGYARLTQESA
jgi:hypothetical protein